jgi:hypothetical protein
MKTAISPLDAVFLAAERQAKRADARRFYERFGFEPTHVGLKLRLAPA